MRKFPNQPWFLGGQYRVGQGFMAFNGLPEDVLSEIFEEELPVIPWRTHDSYEGNYDEDLEPMVNKAGCCC